MGRISFLVLTVLVAALGCGGEEPASESPRPSGDELVKIRIGHPTATLINGQVGFVLQHTDILERHGLEAEITGFAYGAPMMEALAAGNIDVSFTTEGPATLLLSKKVPAKIIASLGLGGARSALLVPADSQVTEVSDLAGATVAVPFGSTPHIHAVRWLQEAGLEPGESVDLINLATGELETALASGDVDAIVYWEPNVSQLVSKLGARVVEDGHFTFATIMREDYIESHRDAARRFLQAVAEAVVYMATHKDRVNQWFSEGARASTEVIHEASLHTPAYTDVKALGDVDLGLGPDALATFQQSADFYVDQGMVEQRVDIEAAIDRELWPEAQERMAGEEFDPAAVQVTR